MRQSCRIRSGTRCSARCCTSARHPSVRAQLHRKVGAALERERAAGVPVAAAELAMHFERGREPMAALRYYAEAAEAALRTSARDECMSLTERALTLLEQAPEGAERNALEITLATLHGVAATQVLGVGQPKRRARSSERTRCSPTSPSIRCADACCTASASCFACAPSMPRRWRWRNEPKRSRRAPNDPVLVLVACTVHGQVDQLQGRSRAARTWLERGLAAAELLERGAGEIFVADPQVTLLGLLAIHAASSWAWSSRARAPGARARTRSRCWDGRWRGWSQSGTSALFEVRLGNTERVARSGRRDARARRRIRARARSNRVPVVSRLGGRPDGTTARRLSPHPRGVRRQYAARNARGRKRGPGLCGGGAGARRRLGWRATRTRGSAASRGHARRARVSAAAVPDARLRSRVRVATAQPPTPRCGARSRRRERRRRHGSS